MAFKNEHEAKAYWHENLKTMIVLLSLWFMASFGCGILLVDVLNQIQFFGFKLGFWFAQQGAICVFVGLIFIYVIRMNRLDHQYHVYEEDDAP